MVHLFRYVLMILCFDLEGLGCCTILNKFLILKLYEERMRGSLINGRQTNPRKHLDPHRGAG